LKAVSETSQRFRFGIIYESFDILWKTKAKTKHQTTQDASKSRTIIALMNDFRINIFF